MPRVKNLVTGLVWDVPAGHYALTSSEYEVVPEPKRVAPKPKAVPKPRKGSE